MDYPLLPPEGVLHEVGKYARGAPAAYRTACRTRFKTAIAAARPFLGLCPSPLLWLKALDALYNFPAAGKVVGGKPGAR